MLLKPIINNITCEENKNSSHPASRASNTVGGVNTASEFEAKYGVPGSVLEGCIVEDKLTSVEDDPTQQVLIQAGLIKPPKDIFKPAITNKETLIKALDESGGSIEDVANTLITAMKFGENENIKMRAAEINMRIRGVLEEAEKAIAPVININIVPITQELHNSNGLINLIMPRV